VDNGRIASRLARVERLRTDLEPLLWDVNVNAAGTVAFTGIGWLVAVNLAARHAPWRLVLAAIGVTVVALLAIAGTAWLAEETGRELRSRLRDIAVNIIANALSAALVWLVLAGLNALRRGRLPGHGGLLEATGGGQLIAVAALLIVAAPLLAWFRLARDVGVNLLCTVVVLAGGLLVAIAGGFDGGGPWVTAAATIAVTLPLASLAVMVAVPAGGRSRGAVLREISVNLIANLVAAAVLGLLLAVLGVLHLDRYLAFFALLFLVLPAIFGIMQLQDELEFWGDSRIGELFFGLLRLLLGALWMAIWVGFPLALWQVSGRPDLRAFAVLVVLGNVALLAWAWVRERRLGANGKRVQDLWLLCLVVLLPSSLIVVFALAIIATSPDTPGWLRELITFVLSL
jgi:hypothetical protein